MQAERCECCVCACIYYYIALVLVRVGVSQRSHSQRSWRPEGFTISSQAAANGVCVAVLYIYSCHIVAYSISNTPVAKHRPHSTAITPDRISESRARAHWRQDNVNCGIFCQASRLVTRQTDLPIWAPGYVVRFLTRAEEFGNL